MHDICADSLLVQDPGVSQKETALSDVFTEAKKEALRQTGSMNSNLGAATVLCPTNLLQPATSRDSVT